MAKDFAIKVENVSKKYCKSLRKSMLYGTKDIAKNALGLSSNSKILRPHEFWAVDNISFEVKKGETLGIIGPNGSGKTTILKMLNGIFWPDKGKITIKGKTGALISVGAGFHPMLTGRENIYLNGAILGMSRYEVNRKFDDIVEFADIGDFLDTPVKFYSSGMFVRLGFSVAVHCEPDILLVDEVLAVGDLSFRAKCFNKMSDMRKRGVTTVMVSHRMPTISGFSQNALYLKEGTVRYIGDVDEAIYIFKQDMSHKNGGKDLEFNQEDVKGSGRVRFTRIQFLDKKEKEVKSIKAYSPVTLRLYYSSEKFSGKVELDVCIRDEKGNMFFRGTNESYRKKLVIVKNSGYFDVYFKRICANNQQLHFYIALWRHKRMELFDWKRGLSLFVKGNPLSHGNVLLDVEWKDH